MTHQQPEQNLPSPKILLPLGIVLALAALAALLLMDLNFFSAAMAVIIGLGGIGMTVQSITRLRKGEQ